MRRTIIITGIVALVGVIALFIFNKLTSVKDDRDMYAEVQKGYFEISVSGSGELMAENSLDIKAPEILRRGRDIRGANIKIQDLIPEGTIVRKGDYIATLDRTEFDNTLKDERERLEQYRTNLEMKMLDTAVTLTSLRDDIRNQRHSVEEAEINLLNSKFEPPTTIRQAEINLDKQQRLLEQKERSYVLRVAQARRDIATQRMWLSRIERRVRDYEEILEGFTVRAPSPGMVIYKKDRRGTKIRTGSTINPFERVVATLPDLSTMLSKIYVSEIEISKVEPGQEAIVNVDAFPDKVYKGIVESVANIGEKLPNTDSKVFEVVIKLEGSDPGLRPSMTTGNKIIIKTLTDVIYVPIETVHTESDGVTFVYTKNKTRQVVVPGEANDRDIVIYKGLEEGDLVYIIQPENPENFRMVGNELAVSRF